MGYTKLENLIAQMSPEQQILVSQFYAKFDVGSGTAHRKILNVEPLYYRGVIAGQEFLTYALTKMYISLELECSVLTGDIDNVSIGWIHGLDEGNAIHFSVSNNTGYYGVAAHYMFGNVIIKNIDFAAIEVLKYTYMKFLGYRITLT
jgi:hypothetical protein